MIWKSINNDVFNMQLMKLMAVRRVQMATTGKSEVPLPPSHPPHPGYAANAALHAIKRHHAEFAAPKAQAVIFTLYFKPFKMLLMNSK